MSAYLTAEEAATQIRVSTDWIRRQCNAKVIPATKVGREWRITPDDLDSFMRKHRGTGIPTPQPRGSQIKRHRKKLRTQ